MSVPKQRVLLVEDFEDLRETYYKILQSAGFSVDTASNLDEAVERIDKKTYHVAVVDIMLAGLDRSNLDGLVVMERINNLDEGTKVIALSSQIEPSIAVDTIRKYGVADYLDKKNVNRTRDLVDPVWKASSSCKLNLYGRFHDIFGVLANVQDSRAWQNKVISLLRLNGYEALESALDKLVGPFLPLIPPGGESVPTRLLEDSRTVQGKFWSKAIGQAIELIAFHDMNLSESSQKVERQSGVARNPIHSIQQGRIRGFIFTINDARRQQFVGH